MVKEQDHVTAPVPPPRSFPGNGNHSITTTKLIPRFVLDMITTRLVLASHLHIRFLGYYFVMEDLNLVCYLLTVWISGLSAVTVLEDIWPNRCCCCWPVLELRSKSSNICNVDGFVGICWEL